MVVVVVVVVLEVVVDEVVVSTVVIGVVLVVVTSLLHAAATRVNTTNATRLRFTLRMTFSFQSVVFNSQCALLLRAREFLLLKVSSDLTKSQVYCPGWLGNRLLMS